MKNDSSIGKDPDLQFLNDILANRAASVDIQFSPERGVIQQQKYIVQYDEIIQSFDTGLLAMMGLITTINENSPCKYLNKDVMEKITYSVLMSRDPKLDIYSFIQQRHQSEGIDLSNSMMTEIRCELEKTIFEDDTGMILNVSPFLSGLNGLINVFLDGNMTQLIIYIDDHKVQNSHSEVKSILQRFFPKSDDCPVLLEFSNTSFHTFIKSLTKDYTDRRDLTDVVIFTTDRNFIEDTVMNDELKNLSVVFPQYNCYRLTKDTPSILHNLKPECEYVAYNSKLLKL